MEIIETIRFYGHVIDVYGTPEEPLFLAVDIAKMIDYSVGNVNRMLEELDDYDKALINTHTPGRSNRGYPYKWFLTENGLYEVLMTSSKPISKHFKIAVKKILRDMRRQRNDSPAQFFEHLDDLADLHSLNALREDMGLDPLSEEEYRNR